MAILSQYSKSEKDKTKTKIKSMKKKPDTNKEIAQAL